MNYSELSDFEINKLVAERLGEYKCPPSGHLEEQIGDIGIWHDEVRVIHNCFDDYCNNPSDAWPIIVENRIALMPDSKGDWLAVNYGNPEKGWLKKEKNPLRAAMIVYLMMENESE